MPDTGIHVFVGTDDLMVKEAAQKACCELMPADAGEFGLETIEGSADNADHVTRIIRNTLEAIQTMPFFGGDKVVWLKGANFLADNVLGGAQATLEALEQLMNVLRAGLPQGVRFILSASEVDKRRSFYLQLKKIANVQVFDLVDTSRSGWEEAVTSLVNERARESGLRFDDDALSLFIMLAGEDTRQIRNELEKLDLYLGDERRVTVDDVHRIVSPSKGGVVFELGNALGKRQLPEALALVDELLEQGESPVGILLAAIVPKVRNLLHARDLLDRCGLRAAGYQAYVAAAERLPEREREFLPKKKDGGLNLFPLFLASKEAPAFSADSLRAALAECLKANRRLVTSSLDPVIVLNQLLVRILAGRDS